MAGSIGAYRGNGIDCDLELAALGIEVGRKFFYFAQKIVTRRTDHWSFQTFTEYLDVPVYKAEFGESLAIIVVEENLDQEIVVTLMLACEARPGSIDGHNWDGKNMVLLRDRILLPRLQDYFG